MSTSPRANSGWIIFFLALLCISPLKAAAAKEPVIRVLIGNESKANFRADDLRIMMIKGIPSKQKRINSLKLNYNNGEVKYSINNNKNEWFELPIDFHLSIKNNDKRGIWFKNRRYAGELKVSLNNQKIQIVNYIKLEKYLKSVVGSEMPKEFPLAALQSQAIAARTYALQLLGKKRFFDVQSNEASQVYLGLEAETPKINRAVTSTRSLALFYKKKLINAVFHSSSGGRTEDSGKVWKYQLPYLISVKDYDQKSTKYKWSKRFTAQELIAIFPELGGLNSIQVIQKSNTDRVLKVVVHGPNGKKFISGKELRNKLKLLSTKFIADLKFPQSQKESKLKNVNYSKKKNNFLFNEGADISFSSKSLPPIPKDYFLYLQGFGAGHGVGLSQWGARGMAKKGAGYREILKHYYRGVEIRSYKIDI